MNMVPLTQCWREWVDCDDAAERMAEQIADGTAETPTRALPGKEPRVREGGLGLSPSARPVATDMAAEAEVTEKCIEWLGSKGWRCLRMQSGLFRTTHGYKGRVRVGETGMADWLCLNYKLEWKHFVVDIALSGFWLEIKAPGKQISKVQRVWQKAEIERGATIIIADSLESLQFQYREIFG